MHAEHSSFQAEKLEHVILFFLERINNITLGRTKLMKLLYYVDFDHCEKTGRPITNANYRKLPHGPVPDEAEDVIEKMVKAGAVQEVQRPVGSFTQHRLLTDKAKFDAAIFSGDEIETLESVAKRWCQASAKEIEKASHREAPWATTEDGKTIDYEMAEYRSPCDDGDEIDWLAKSDEFKKLVSSLA